MRGIIVERIGSINSISVAGNGPHHIGMTHVAIRVTDGGGCVLASPSLFLGIAARLGATRHPEVLRHVGLHFGLLAPHEAEIVFSSLFLFGSMSYLVLFSVDCVSLASKFVAVSDGQATLPAKSGPNCTSRPRALTINCSYCVRSPGSELDDPQGGKRKEGRVGWSCEGEKDFAVEEVTSYNSTGQKPAR